jgi:ElaB/YqjD/DUF883 family membrane-anchored ribosome-binding protein
MNKNYTQEVPVDTATPAGDGSALLNTTDVKQGKEIYGTMKESVAASAKACDQLVRQNTYTMIGIAMGAGAALGYLFSRPSGRSEEP